MGRIRSEKYKEIVNEKLSPGVKHERLHNELESTLQRTKYNIYAFYSVVLALLTICVYWVFEPDPLTVEYVKGEPVSSSCKDHKFTFKRNVVSTKDLEVIVQERYTRVDDGTPGSSYVSPNTVRYVLGGDFHREMMFQKEVPRIIGKGSYIYEPWVTYRVNPIKTITRMLPPHQLEAICED